MPGYVEKALQQFQHKLNKKQYQPFPHTPVQYGKKKQYAKEELVEVYAKSMWQVSILRKGNRQHAINTD
jgi:hypothetical protein